ncbi:hypothetical protein PUNSTDRAFT_43384 [Punctularia strigosozonata HHB-11173 SS5]|uniref:uncharacterized protein n=1 Tax=Punctularia strigosozonata (strain HHB-11173) TaxID=741275 RepID=UPI0004416AEE|nr:uncharacterized protein PUNSTDRAFT_43384 [Punctularia strigosozonata HHB-11173 SS5]EIN10490.1 hypothetical protein PUNSTDRAFT_43384 [Punctularia strigosozonata HHB-11173 SS5]
MVSYIVGSFMVVGAALVLYDYMTWVSSGTGGIPPTPYGYLRSTKLWMKQLLGATYLRDSRPLENEPALQFLPLGSIPPRRGGRPQMRARPLPHRQIVDELSSDIKEQILALTERVHEDYPRITLVRPSRAGGETSVAIYANPDLPTLNKAPADALQCEIAHAPPEDGAFHVLLSPADAVQVIRAYWGEQFAIPDLSPGYILVYAPRDGEELEIVGSILRAVHWVTGASSALHV